MDENQQQLQLRFDPLGALTTGTWRDQIAFIKSDGSIVLVIGNSSKTDLPLQISLADRTDANTLAVLLPAGSINPFVIPK